MTPTDLAEVLAAHQYVSGLDAYCKCGNGPYIDDADMAAHQAQAWRDACTPGLAGTTMPPVFRQGGGHRGLPAGERELSEVDRLLEDHKFSPDGSIFEPESLQDICERLGYIDEHECVCNESPHLNALHDLAYDDVPALLTVLDTLTDRIAALEQAVARVREARSERDAGYKRREHGGVVEDRYMRAIDDILDGLDETEEK